MLPVPFDPVPMVETMWWHPLYRHNPDHRWLRELMTTAANDVPPPAL